MKIIYIKNIPRGLNFGEVKEVADGYAQNFLFPKGLAFPATKENIDKIKNNKTKKEKEAVLDLFETEKLARQLDGLRIIFKENANAKGTLFAAISEKDIYRELEKKNIKVGSHILKLSQHIKKVGEHQATLYLNHGIIAKVSILVEKR